MVYQSIVGIIMWLAFAMMIPDPVITYRVAGVEYSNE